MAEDDSARADEAAFIATLYGDPVREPTFKAGRNLIIAALLLIAVMKFGAQVQSTSVFPITFKSPDVLPTVLAALVLLLLLNFLARVVMDVGLFIEGERRIEGFLWRAKEEAALAAARDVDRQFEEYEDEGPPSEPDPWWEPVAEVRKAANDAQETIEKRLGRNNLFRIFRQLRAGGEILVPVALATRAVLSGRSWPKAWNSGTGCASAADVRKVASESASVSNHPPDAAPP